jgi:hypothetical protein
VPASAPRPTKTSRRAASWPPAPRAGSAIEAGAGDWHMPWHHDGSAGQCRVEQSLSRYTRASEPPRRAQPLHPCRVRSPTCCGSPSGALRANRRTNGNKTKTCQHRLNSIAPGVRRPANPRLEGRSPSAVSDIWQRLTTSCTVNGQPLAPTNESGASHSKCAQSV